MSQVEVEITSLAITSRYGTLSAGDILRTDAEYAKHLVEEAFCAKFTKPKAAPVQAAQDKPAPTPPKAIRGPKAKAAPPADANASASADAEAKVGAEDDAQTDPAGDSDAPGADKIDPAAADTPAV